MNKSSRKTRKNKTHSAYHRAQVCNETAKRENQVQSYRDIALKRFVRDLFLTFSPPLTLLAAFHKFKQLLPCVSDSDQHHIFFCLVFSLLCVFCVFNYRLLIGFICNEIKYAKQPLAVE